MDKSSVFLYGGKRKEAALKIKLYCYALTIIGMIILCYDPKLAFSIFATYWQSETTAGLWLAQGWSPMGATIVTAFLGDLSVFNGWIVLFYALDRWPWMKRIMDTLCKLSPNRAEANSWKYRLGWPAIFALSLLPEGGIWLSLGIAKVLNVNKWRALVLVVLVGNTLKSIFWAKVLIVMLTKNPFLKRNLNYAVAGLLLMVTTLALAKILPKLRESLLPQPVLELED